MIQSLLLKINHNQKWTKFPLLMIGVIVLASCTITSTKLPSFDENQNAQYYLSQINTATSDGDKANWSLLAIRALIKENNLTKAQYLIDQLPTDLNQSLQIEKNLLQAELAAKKQTTFNTDLIPYNSLNYGQKIRYYQAKIILDGQNQDINAQVRDYVELEKYGSTQQRHAAINDTWNYLLTLNDDSLNSILVYVNESTLQGWIDLLYTYKNNSNIYPILAEDDPQTIAQKEDAQYQALQNAVSEWMAQYSTHPASLFLPRNIYGEKYRLPDDTHQKNIALFLPLSGASKPFGDAIHLGYHDAYKYYPQENAQNITVYDTNSDSLANLVNQAQQKGAEIIVGPLLKQDVQTIIQLKVNIPILALNKLDNQPDLQNKICFFSLSPEDESTDAAQYIKKQNKTLPLLIIPRNNLGDRIVQSFLAEWSRDNITNSGIYVQYFDSAQTLRDKMNSGQGIELEGEHISVANPYQNNRDLSNSVNLTNIDDISMQSTEPQFDAIYVYASHDELSLIKSMLEMKSNKTEDEKIIPKIYSSSRSNVANTNQDFRYDMDKLQFSEIPLIVNNQNNLENLPQYIKDDYSLVRLYAMGVDAWYLANKYEQLTPHQTNMIDGMTGELSVENGCLISRKLPWIEYRQGKEVIVQ